MLERRRGEREVLERRGVREVLERRGVREVLGRRGERLVGWVVGFGCWGSWWWVLWMPLLVAFVGGWRREGDWGILRYLTVLKYSVPLSPRREP